ncbi:MAG: SpoIIE family protein phosphatase [Bacteroidetes bacterium]|nr:SpoIIE family protein phosphatase [Bacteroidota bacterium]
MFTKLRNQILVIFSFFILISLSLIALNYSYTQQKNKLEQIHHTILDINNSILRNTNTINNFFTYDTKNPNFFIIGYSEYLTRHQQNVIEIRKKVRELQNLEGFKQFDIAAKINTINNELDLYENNIKEIVKLIIRRGYKDYGTEGKMRDYIHYLENIENIDLSQVLMLRRHEKDYIIRNETKYINKLNDLARQFKTDINTNKKLTAKNRKDALEYLTKYLNYFSVMVELDNEIGIKDNTGLKHKIHLQGNKITELFNQVYSETLVKKDQYFKKLRNYYALSITMLILLSIYLSLYISKRLTKNISLLSLNISSFVTNNFDQAYGNHFPSKYSKDEVGILIDNYLILREEILSLINDFQKKVEQRTKAIECQKDRIGHQKEEIEAQRDELYRQNQIIQEQQEKTEQQNKDIIASIQYAKLIQDALLPSQETMNRYFTDNFVLYKPKDIISGDFYWTKRIKNEDYNISLIAAVDCTGHGVPGALMSMLGVAFLNEIILKKEVKKANHILDKLREKVIESFQYQSDNSMTNDGMDLALVLIDHNTKKLHFTGANRPLYFIRNKELQVIEGDKMPIGKHGISKGHFKNNSFNVQKDDVFYLFSDGYADQFGGPRNKKFKRQRLREFILDMHEQPMPKQKELLETEHEKWRGVNRQTDDILILGIRL